MRMSWFIRKFSFVGIEFVGLFTQKSNIVHKDTKQAQLCIVNDFYIVAV